MVGTFTFIDHTLGEWDIQVLKDKKVSKLERLRKTNEDMMAALVNVSSRIGQIQ